MVDWFHFLLHEDGRSMHEDVSGNVSSSASPVKIQRGPDGWKDISIGYERDEDATGLIKVFSFPLKFVRDGGKIIRNVMYTAGCEFKLFYRIALRTVEVIADVIPLIKDYHKFFFRGQVNLSKAKDSEHHVTVTIGPVGLERNLDAFKDEIYEFPLSHEKAENIELNGTKLYSTANFQAPPAVEYDDALFSHDHTPGFGFTTKEGDSSGIAVFNQVIGSVTGLNVTEFVKTSTNYFIGADVANVSAIPITLKGKLIVKITKRDIPGSVRFWFRSNLGQIIEIITQATTINVSTIIPINHVITLQPGERLFLHGRVFGFFPTGSIGFKYVFMEGSDIAISWGNRYKSTYIRGFSLYNLMELVITEIGGKTGQVISELLTTLPYSGLYLTSGDGVRGLPNAVVKISFKNLWTIIKVNCRAGYSIENNMLVIEDITRYWDWDIPDDEVIDLGDAKVCDITPAADKMYNSIEIGHKDKDIEGVNGKYRFNTVHQYLSKRTSEKKKLSLVSPAIADPYIIEHMRINFDGKTTTDSDKDNDLVLIHGEKTTTDDLKGIALRTNPITIASGGAPVTFESYNNIGFVPNSDYSEFKWTGTSPINITLLRLFVTPLTTPAVMVTTSIHLNGTLVASALFLGDGNRTTDIGFSGIIQPNDVFTIRSTATSEIQILRAEMTVVFDDLPIVKLLRVAYDSLVGVPDDTVFNVELITPKRLLKHWMLFINSCFYKMDGTLLTYQTSDRNPELKTESNGVIIDEDADETIGIDILFKTLYFDEESLVPIDLVDRLENKPNTPFKFNWLGVTLKGHLMKGGIAMSDNRSQVYKLLCTPDTDETKLIR